MLDPGVQIGSYEIVSFLGSGGMASVYQARHTALGSRHAIKILDPNLAKRDALRARFIHEGQVLAQVRHPALVRVTDVVDEPGIAGLVMDFLEGEDLEERLRSGPMPPPVAASILLQALSAVGHAHEAGVIHRDLKPANLFLIDRPGRLPLVKVLDFGIAKLRGSNLTKGSGTMGTIAYMSPEQIEHPNQVDARSDLFALGVVLFEMVAGEPPFSGSTDFAIMQRIVQGDRDPLPETAGVLAPVVRRALEPEPGERFQSTDAFAAALGHLVPPDVAAMVSEWEGEGGIEVTEPLPRPVANAHEAGQTVALLPPTAPEGAGAAVADPLDDAQVIRIAGTMQLLSGLFNVFIMSAVQCFGLGWLGGLPACFGMWLLIVGCAEVMTGLATLSTGRARWVRNTAWLEVLSLAGAGVVSGAVGLFVLAVRKRYPQAIP